MNVEHTTLNHLFPGTEGRMELVRVMLHLRMPELRRVPRDQQLEPELARRLERALTVIRQG